MNGEKLVGKVVTIKTGCYAGDWGVVKHYDGKYYHIALWGGLESLVYGRDEIVVKRKRK